MRRGRSATGTCRTRAMPEAEAIDFLLKQMSRSKNNKEFFVQMREG